jgi:hypothetical protein
VSVYLTKEGKYLFDKERKIFFLTDLPEGRMTLQALLVTMSWGKIIVKLKIDLFDSVMIIERLIMIY